jgi:uncharacterized membrane protein YqhA
MPRWRHQWEWRPDGAECEISPGVKWDVSAGLRLVGGAGLRRFKWGRGSVTLIFTCGMEARSNPIGFCRRRMVRGSLQMSQETPEPEPGSGPVITSPSAQKRRALNFGLLDAFFALRGVLLVASCGSILGAMLMLWAGGVNLLHAYQVLAYGGVETPAAGEMAVKAAGKAQVTIYMLEAIDAFLFALVLMIFAYGVAMAFVFHDVSKRHRERLPQWMLVGGASQLKRALVEVVIVILVVIFARLVIESDVNIKWEMLVLPISIALLALSLQLLGEGALRGDGRPSDAFGAAKGAEGADPS